MAKTIEELKAQSAEVKNASVIGENTATRVGTLFNDIVEHVEAYEAGQAQKDTEQSTSINEETSRATAAETTLSARINQEVTDRKAMEETIGVQLSNEIERAKGMELGISTKLNDEIERAQEVENDLQEKITSEAEARDLAISNEALARTQNDQLLSRAIVAERERAEAAEEANATAINTQDQKLSELEDKTEDIEKSECDDSDDEIVFTDNEDNIVGSITPEGADFVNIKKDGKEVATKDEIPEAVTIDDSIGEIPSTTNVPTSKAVADYVEEHGHGGLGFPISKEEELSEKDEIVFCDEGHEDNPFVIIDRNGIKTKGISDMDGNPIDGGGSDEFKNMLYVTAGDSITEGAAMKRAEDVISNDDPYKPLSGWARKTYGYYIAKYNGMRWLNDGVSGSTLADVFCYGGSRNGWSKENGRYTQLPDDVDYISIWFGYNDLAYGHVMKRDEWLLETYGRKIYYPRTTADIGTTHADGTPYATQEQYDACNAVTGEVDGKIYTNNMQYFIAKFVGKRTDVTNKTWWGAYNVVLKYLIEKYPFAKILVITGYGGTDEMCDVSVAAAKKWGVGYLDFREPNQMAFVTKIDKADAKVYYDPNKYSDRTQYGDPVSGLTGDIAIQYFKINTLLVDQTHPNGKGYKYIYPSIKTKLLTL